MIKIDSVDLRCVNAVRLLAVDMVERANSGHPGMPLGAAPMAYLLWSKFLRHNPENPEWIDRDRFILSAGHGSALLYALLHLFGYGLTMDDLKSFRQWGSRTPGHPEFGHTVGVEATTGPLGQGFAMGVGMAIAESQMAARFNRPQQDIIGHHTYAIVSDGDLMEGVTAEAASLAGHLKLGKLIYLYDDNGISIEGSTKIAFGEDVLKRFESYGWHVSKVSDGEDLEQIASAIGAAKSDDRPSLISIKTHIGFGSPREDSSKAHGEPLGRANIEATKKKLGWPQIDFHLPEDCRARFAEHKEMLATHEGAWRDRWANYSASSSELALNLISEWEAKFPSGWERALEEVEGPTAVATRSASGKAINALAKRLPNLIGGSADLAPSNNTTIDGGGDFSAENRSGRNLHFGIREHAMGAITNGIALHGGMIPYCATFLAFSDYMRPTLRLAAMMKLRSIFVFTHDSIGLGEDGPTHQPVEHAMSLRLIPGLNVLRPADAQESFAAWKVAIESDGPTALLLSRQSLPLIDLEQSVISAGVAKGAYIVADCEKTPDCIIIATGSELKLAIDAREILSRDGIGARVVSMPSWELFDKEPQSYRDSILPEGVRARIAIEAGVSSGWERYIGDSGDIVGLDHFGASAPAATLMKEFGFQAEAIVLRVKKLMNR